MPAEQGPYGVGMPAPCMPMSRSLSCIRLIASRNGMANVVLTTSTSHLRTLGCSAHLQVQGLA